MGTVQESQTTSNGEWWNRLERPTTSSLSRDLAAYALPKIKQDGPFTGLLENAPNGFLTSIANDFDVAYNGEVNAPTYNYDSNSPRKLTTYWTDRLGENHPLRDIYSRFYSKTGQSYWDQVSDLDGSTLKPTASSIYKDYIADPTTKDINIGTNKFTVLGPVSNSNIKADDGNKVIAASPVMTPVVHRTQRLSDESSDNYDVLRADTILYPSPVGAYHTNTLDIGNGNSIVYYDSSFKKISSRTGDQIFLPSFGAFNWSIDWIPGYEGDTDGRLNESWLKGKQWTGGAPLISPIPWDDVIINPMDGKDAKKTQQSYAEAMSKFATLPERGDLNSQRNYLYTIFSKRGDSGNSDEFSYTYLNLQADRDGGDPLISRNPVNRLGGVKIVAGKFSKDRGVKNYSIPSGDKTFFGMDWELWQLLLPKQGSTLAKEALGNWGLRGRIAQAMLFCP